MQFIKWYYILILLLSILLVEIFNLVFNSLLYFLCASFLQKLDEFSSSCNALTKKAEENVENFSEVDSKLEEVTEALSARTDGPENGEASSVMALKQAIKRLKNDVIGFELLIGILSADIRERQHNSSILTKAESKSKRVGRNIAGKYSGLTGDDTKNRGVNVENTYYDEL